MEIKCHVCKKTVNFDYGMGSCYIGHEPHCSQACGKKTLGISEALAKDWHPKAFTGNFTQQDLFAGAAP